MHLAIGVKTVIQASLYRLSEHRDLDVPWGHVTHCLDSLRQAVLCKVDSTLLYTKDAKVFGDGQVHACHDWTSLVQWAENHALVQEL